jgi:hypothetical protein
MCNKGIFTTKDFRCYNCKSKICKICGNRPQYNGSGYDKRGDIYCLNKKKCIPLIWEKYYYETSRLHCRNLRNTMTIIASSCRSKKINMYCANIILSFYDKGNISDKKIAQILEKFVYLKKMFFMF